ncbi:ABC transporter permease [uncultured Propionibacterium sp.]|uniref:ABC transporter permease n=1 Tax=uncultured Propionibacterium sp. TaxID=218066 RepID=UPI002930EA8C|nr:ABC transporter permease [uncultured Propionibacterium sp.]
MVLGLVLMGFLLVVFALPHGDPTAVDLGSALAGPSRAHPLGTDRLGRDLWSLLAAGFWRTLAVVTVTCATSLLIGIPCGLIAGYLGKAADAVIMTLTDLTMVVPSFIAALIITSAIGLTPVSAGAVLGVFGAGPYVNQTRALTRSVRGAEYVRVEMLLGTPTSAILARFVLPAVADPLLRYFGSTASGAVLSYAGLAFIGLGLDGTLPDWGTTLYQNRTQVDHPALILWPAAGVLALSLVFQLFCDASVAGGDEVA